MTADTGLEQSRREFLRHITAGAFVLASTLDSRVLRAIDIPHAAPDANGAVAPHAFLRIGADDRITVLLAHSEMGQGIWTTLAMLVAEELDCDLESMVVEHAPAAPAYTHLIAPLLQSTGGSSTTITEFLRYRRIGATARTMLLSAAASRLGVPVARCRTERGAVIAGRRRLRYGALARDAAQLPTPARVLLKSRGDFRFLGRATPRLDTPAKVDGRAVYGLDVAEPKALTAVVSRPPAFGAKLIEFDSTKALVIPGVRAVVRIDAGVAVVGDGFHAALKGRDALLTKWDESAANGLSTASITQHYVELAKSPGLKVREQGELPPNWQSGDSIDVTYFLPFLAHAMMEPENCTVRLTTDRCEIWTGTQMQTLYQRAAAEETGLPLEKIALHTPFLGGGFGRRAEPSGHIVREAVQTARAAGHPIKLVWTREDDIRGGYYRPLYVHRIRVALGEKGLPQAWHHTIVGQGVATGTPMEPLAVRDGIDQTSISGALTPYLDRISAHRVDLHTTSLPIPAQAWRSVGHSHNAFVVESLIDELAAAAARDPLDYRRELLSHAPRWLAVLERAAAAANWTATPPQGTARGLAVHESFGSFVAIVAEISLQDIDIRVHRIVCAFDCGFAVNPDGVKAQVESAIAYALGAALFGEVTLEAGRVQQSNFHEYRVLRFNEMPQVEAILIEGKGPMGGAGEPAVPPLAPAVANAVARLTGKRLRRLPLQAAFRELK